MDCFVAYAPRNDGVKPKNLRMSADIDAKLIEEGRKLFAGEWKFVWASPSIETLPPMAGVEVAFAGRSNVGKSSLIMRSPAATRWRAPRIRRAAPRN